ncbi:unnamed protein product [Linum trigynum]|uniref:Uncharacterized protein n=1 Tax=Linum trigynum TaxID=586398 RepID=A0AAV2FBX6_9ROSI
MWCHLLALHERVYYELVIKFYSTFDHAETTDWKNYGAIKFRLSGDYHYMSYHDFAAFALVPDYTDNFVVEIANPDIVSFPTCYRQLA